MLNKSLKPARLFALSILATLMSVAPAQASYKNNCLLTGHIVSEINSNEIPNQAGSKLDFQLAITAVEKYGRADSGCEQFINTKIDIEIYQDVNNPIVPSLTKGSHLKIIQFEGDVETNQANYERLLHYRLF